MSINKVNTTSQEQTFTFYSDQSSILRTTDTNNITMNGVNVIVDRPKRGDVMCITNYKTDGVLLDADKQKVVWIDGMSINPNFLSQEYEPVGICLSVKGNKALVRYREEKELTFKKVERYHIGYSSYYMSNSLNTDKIINVVIHESTGSPKTGSFHVRKNSSSSRPTFASYFNNFFKNNNLKDYSVDLQSPTSDTPVSTNNTNNRIILSCPANFDSINISYSNSSYSYGDIEAPIPGVSYSDIYYKNNGFVDAEGFGGCCRDRYSNYINTNQVAPTAYAYINTPNSGATVDNSIWAVKSLPTSSAYFSSHKYCGYLRTFYDNDYDKYLDSWMVKSPCGAGGSITDNPSGKENTYKLESGKYLNNKTGENDILYPAANWAASISLNAPKLGKGNWWLPSSAELVEIMRDITYTDTAAPTDNTDIINRVIYKLNNNSTTGTLFSYLKTDVHHWSSSTVSTSKAYISHGNIGCMYQSNMTNSAYAMPITIYEF